MNKNRLEAFSDGVLAIIITIMVLEIKIPQVATLESLLKLGSVFLSYIISFIYVGIYWNNHHHLFQSINKIDGKVLWANLFLLFWLSLIPFTSGWMGENNFASITVTMYGFVLFMSAFGYYLLTVSLLNNHSTDSKLHKAVGNKTKERISMVTYIVALILSFWNPIVAFALYAFVAILWLYPDSRIEKVLSK